jgi:SAM-dependent methyltransferase
MDYDASSIPAGYDRGRSLSSETLDLWMDAVARWVPSPPRTILDLGCGTGRFTGPLAERFKALTIALDPSRKMLAEAAAKQIRSARLVRGSGEAIPLRDETIDLVFTSMAYHHFSDAVRVAEECHRVSRPHAVTFVRTGTRDRIDEYPYVPFIPATRPLLDERLSSVDEITRTFQSVGFDTIFTGTVVQPIARSFREYAMKLEAGGDSVLASLTPDVLRSGLDGIRRYSDRVDPLLVTEPIDILVFRAR